MTRKVTALLICGHHKKEADGFPYREIFGFKQSYSPTYLFIEAYSFIRDLRGD
jgi:hypothetical protein